MAKRRGNPNWGKPEPIGPVVPTITSFELVVKEYKLTPDQYVRSTRLREWARRNIGLHRWVDAGITPSECVYRHQGNHALSVANRNRSPSAAAVAQKW